MKTDSQDRVLAERFAELRRIDGAGVPDFDALMRPRPRGRRIVVAGWRVTAVAALALIVAGLPLLRRESVPNEAELQQWAVLSGWQATTDKFLQVTDSPWGNPWSTKTDQWIQSGSDSTETAPSGATETL